VFDELAEMGLDVIKAHVDQSLQPKAHMATAEKELSFREPSFRDDETGPPSQAPAGEERSVGSIGRRRTSSRFSLTGRYHQNTAPQPALNRVIYSTTHEGQKTTKNGQNGAASNSNALANGHGLEENSYHGHHHLTVGQETFYMRESDPNKWTDAARRNEIKEKLVMLLKKHRLHGEVMVRTMHSSEMSIVHTVPKLSSEQKESTLIVKCSGKHHKDVLHEMCDHFADISLEVLHAEIDEEHGQEVNLFWIRREDGVRIDEEAVEALRLKLKAIYAAHNVDGKILIGTNEESKPGLTIMRRISKENINENTPKPNSPLESRRARASKESLELFETARAKREARTAVTSNPDSPVRSTDNEVTPSSVTIASVTATSSTTVDSIAIA
jgi:hypothetical protein